MDKRVFLLAAILLPRLAAQQAPAPSPSQAPEIIPLTQIAPRSEELSHSLREISRRLPPASELADFEEQLRQQERVVRASLKETADILAASATIMEIREQARQWKAYGSPEARQRKTLSSWGSACDEAIALLSKELAVWQATLKSTERLDNVKSVLARIRQAVADIRALKGAAEERLRAILDLQGRVAKQALAIEGVQEDLRQATQRFQKRLLYPDARPIWGSPAAPAQTGESPSAPLGRSVERFYSSSAAFVEARKGLLGGTILFLAAAFAAIYRFSRAALKNRSSDPSILEASRLLRRPVSLAILVAAPMVFTTLPLARMSVVLLLIQMFLLPVLRLLPIVTGSSPRIVYFFSAFYAASGLVGVVEFDPVVERQLTAGLCATAILALALWGPLSRVHSSARHELTRRETLVIRGSLAALSFILLSNVLGFLLLSNLVRVALLISSYVGLVMYTLARVGATLFAAVLRARRLSSLSTVRLYEKGIVKWTTWALRAGALGCWAFVTLDLLALKNALLEAVAAALKARLGIGAFSISPGEILACACVLAFGYLIAGAIRFILREEILSRLRLSRGLPEGISNMFYYIALILVFLMSLSAAGVQLNKLTVLTGAIGVGVGFGLQNIINNFVSGVILQFERPIRLGDVLEVGPLSGEVSHIGLRASTIRTFQGADVIIPNSTFISSQVVNWTLSEARRRVDVVVGVESGAQPERVIEILAKVANDHPEVLKQPAPCALFQGFGDSTLQFALTFWADQSTHGRVRSEVAIGINAALSQAGIEIPCPQQDVRVRLLDSAVLQRGAAGGSE